MKYYIPEHQLGYQRLAESGKSSWDELHGSQGFEDAAIRHCLALALPECRWRRASPLALEYGCGTGPGACYLAERGFTVTGIDLNSTAIELARKEAAKRGLVIGYRVGDVCAMPEQALGHYDLIVDAFCLQSIVTDTDRKAVIGFVKNHLERDGYYLICTAGFRETRSYEGAHFDPQLGTVYIAAGEGVGIEDTVEIDGLLYRPYRLHLRVAQLVEEIAAFDLLVKWQHVDTAGNILLLCGVRRS
jgi:SAM-dependent methyltransferase